MIANKIVPVACAALCTLVRPAPVQGESEVGVWLEGGASLELTDRLEIEGRQHLRFDRDVSRISAVMPEALVSFEPLGPLELGVGYRYEYERDNDGDLRGRHRLQADAEIEVDIHRFQPGYRLRLQDHLEDDLSSPTIRHRAKVEWRRRGSWRPEVSGELFYRRDDGTTELRKRRYTFGVELRRDDESLLLFYRIDAPLDEMDPVSHIFGLELGSEL